MYILWPPFLSLTDSEFELVKAFPSNWLWASKNLGKKYLVFNKYPQTESKQPQIWYGCLKKVYCNSQKV